MSLKENQVSAWALPGEMGMGERQQGWASALEEDACSLAVGGKTG